jgi:hypothetical protein
MHYFSPEVLLSPAPMRPLAFILAAAVAALALGCQPDIGDACTLPSDCSASGDRICDTTFSSQGYCTIFNCEPGGCPEEAVCVAYKGVVSSVDGCRSTQEGQRLERTFCMKACDSRDDCRTEDGFTCVDLAEDNAWSAAVVERSTSRHKICALPYSGELIPEDRAHDVCSSTDTGDLPEPLPRTPVSEDAGRDASVPLLDGSPADVAPETSVDAPFTDGASADGPTSDATDAPAD